MSPPLAVLYSETNIANSVSLAIAAQAIEAGYLIYWHTVDAVQTATAWYPNYSANEATYATDAGFQATLAGAAGLLTLRGEMPANPTFITRLSTDGTVAGEDAVMIPALSVTVGPPVVLRDYELGNAALKERVRRLSVEGYARDTHEHARLADYVAAWLDQSLTIPIANHDDASLHAVGTVTVMRPTVAKTTDDEGALATTFRVLYNARLDYIA